MMPHRLLHRCRAQFRCGQCRYAYRIERTRWAALLNSDAGAVGLGASVLVLAALVLGLGARRLTTPRTRAALFVWLRVRARPGTASAAEEVLTLGAAAIGLLVFVLYFLHVVHRPSLLRMHNLFNLLR